ncbi:hypothetical protein [Sphingomonas sp. ID1715]|uniref:hypothetical protein n=1 Tax=Sphingomonas sp. ID1715 TaxID=1656898 RepID=UPI0034A05EC6
MRGAHLVGPHADETISVFVLAIRHGLTATDLKDTHFRLSDPGVGYRRHVLIETEGTDGDLWIGVEKGPR